MKVQDGDLFVGLHASEEVIFSVMGKAWISSIELEQLALTLLNRGSDGRELLDN